MASAIWLESSPSWPRATPRRPAVIEKDVVAMLVDLKTKRVLET